MLMHTLPTSSAPSTPVRRRPARSYATRAATVATISAAAAVLAVLPTGPTGATATPVAGQTATAPVPATPTVLAAAAALPAPAAVPAPVARTGQTMTAAPAAVASSSSVVELALSKVGSPYRWGATGPSSFDCSGLVNWAFDQVGVDVPRTSRALSRAGTPVSRGDLQPGDLVFFYSPVSHVGIYIGNGQMVHASTSGKPVAVADIDGRPYHSARRI